MQSSSGKYFQALDHVRAAAAFLVFCWHFSHFKVSHLETPAFFPLSIFTEGHTGVAVFMTLSGYLFAKLLDGRQLTLSGFLKNRLLRLAPLLALVLIVAGVRECYQGMAVADYIKSIAAGFIFPSWPNGGWSIAVEGHFYLLLPLLLWLGNRSKWLLLVALAAAILVRAVLFHFTGQVQEAAYLTIIGRLDNFLLGIFMFQARAIFANRGYVVFAVAILFLLFWNWFDRNGGYYRTIDFPSPSPVWIILPTLESVAYGMLIAWYDSNHGYSSNRLARFIATIGTYSYSIYLLHFFVVFQMAKAVQKYLLDLSHPLVAIAMSVPAFMLMLPFGWLSYRFIEQPFLKHRSQYLRPAPVKAEIVMSALSGRA